MSEDPSWAIVDLFACVSGQLPAEEGLRAAGRPGCLPQQEVRTRGSAGLLKKLGINTPLALVLLSVERDFLSGIPR